MGLSEHDEYLVVLVADADGDDPWDCDCFPYELAPTQVQDQRVMLLSVRYPAFVLFRSAASVCLLIGVKVYTVRDTHAMNERPASINEQCCLVHDDLR